MKNLQCLAFLPFHPLHSLSFTTLCSFFSATFRPHTEEAIANAIWLSMRTISTCFLILEPFLRFWRTFILFFSAFGSYSNFFCFWNCISSSRLVFQVLSICTQFDCFWPHFLFSIIYICLPISVILNFSFLSFFQIRFRIWYFSTQL